MYNKKRCLTSLILLTTGLCHCKVSEQNAKDAIALAEQRDVNFWTHGFCVGFAGSFFNDTCAQCP
jgi:hypothetical protein